MRRLLPSLLLLLFLPLAGAAAPRPLWILAPAAGQLSQVGPVAFALRMPAAARGGPLVVEVDGQRVPAAQLHVSRGRVSGTLSGLGEGRHEIVARVRIGSAQFEGRSWFELVDLDRPDDCEILNDAECLLPFPSSRYLEPASTGTGYRVRYPDGTLPQWTNLATGEVSTIDPTPFLQNDGFSPTVQVLMSFPAGVDPVASNASRLDPTTRTFGGRGVEDDSPTLLVDLDTGERIHHWIENDDRAVDPARVVTFLRPAEAMLPGHRYAVVARRLVRANGAAVEPEPVFATIRDERPSDIDAVEAARARLEPVLDRLRDLGVAREDLVLAFDFVVQSDASLTGEMLSMRDQALAWLAAQREAGVKTFTVTSVTDVNPGCADPNLPVWREVQGTFQVPLFLERDPFLPGSRNQIAFLLRDANGAPTWTTLTDAPYGVAIPCAVFAQPGGFGPAGGIVIGHGLFGNGPQTITGIAAARGINRIGLVAAATNWTGLSTPDTQPNLLQSFIFKITSNPDVFEALPDRLRQGQANTIVLSRMLAEGHFHDDPAFQGPGGAGVIDTTRPPVYFGASLGGIMGTFFASLTADVEKFNVDVPAINFTLLLQRATPFNQFQQIIDLLNSDPVAQALTIGLEGELWVRGEPAGYANHVTGAVLPPLPGSFPKQMLVTAALYDQQVANLGSQLLARTLRVGSLEGSVMTSLPGIPDVAGPQDSAYIVYDTGSLDPARPSNAALIPPLVNRPPASAGSCDPHGRRAFIPASVDQLFAFYQGEGIRNFCSDDRLCNASQPSERPNDGAVCPP
jgi:hypothetical protein